jgi:hypothetical protein
MALDSSTEQVTLGTLFQAGQQSGTEAHTSHQELDLGGCQLLDRGSVKKHSHGERISLAAVSGKRIRYTMFHFSASLVARNMLLRSFSCRLVSSLKSGCCVEGLLVQSWSDCKCCASCVSLSKVVKQREH